MSDEEEVIFKMSDNEASNFRLHRRSSSSSSSSQKMCIDSDDKGRTNNIRWRQAPPSPLADYIDKSAQIRRPSMIRCHSDTQISFSSVPTTGSTNNSEDAMSETGSIDGSSIAMPSSRRKSYSAGSHSPIPNTFGTDRERSTGGGPERRSVTRRGSLLPKGRQLARIMNQLEEETRSADFDIQHEKEITQNLRKSSIVEMDNHKNEFTVPAAAWARAKEIEGSPTMSPYQCSKLNPEIEMTLLQYDALPSPTNQSLRHIKRKASEDRFEQYQVSGSNFKRRAVSPSVSLTGSPVLSGISSPPANFMMYGTSPTNTSANAAARVQQRTNQPPSHHFNLHDASGGLSKMSLSEE
ncbi:hypothetical protein BC943DRAFT_355968 [Umbelopsis sp. AD052]|nr:hypothetical protein BC943DRAFT_355968 [Umbelopsis sp. AD052]